MTHNGNPSYNYITLSLTEKNQNADQNKWFTTESISYSDLEKTLKSHNYSTITWIDGNRKSDNFHFATGFVVDIDNGLTIQEAENRLNKVNLSYWLIPSKSHSSALHKFHIIIPFNKRVYSRDAYLRTAREITEDLFPECDASVKDAARFMFGSPEDKDFIDHSSGILFDVTKHGEIWDNSLRLIDKDGKEISLDEIDKKLQILCPFHDDDTPSAFIDYSETSENWYISCSACSKTFWMNKLKTGQLNSDRFWSLAKDIWEFGITSEEFFFDKIGREKFHVLTDTEEKDERQKAFRNLVKRNHISHISRIDYLGDIQINKSRYLIKPKKGIVEVYLAALPVKVKDNQFIEKYLESVFEGYTLFIKQWLSVYCYSNYKKLPALLLTGDRGTGKSTFAEIVGEIFPSLTTDWHGHESDFTYEAEKKLLIVEENEKSSMNQYKTLKKYSGQKYAMVKKKFKDPYSVRNNMNMILLSNELISLFVTREELPTDVRNNQFFVFKMKKLKGDIDPNIQHKILDRMGWFIRSELKTVYNNLDLTGKRYSIDVPITDEEKDLFNNSISEADLLTDSLIEHMTLNPSSDYKEFLDSGYFPSSLPDLYIFINNTGQKNKLIKNMKKRNLIGSKSERKQVGQKRNYCYEMTDKFIEMLK